ncbi:MAG TPA: amino acid adenylation domain-containing protein [Pyrinomonadaceae bacterium]|nr:amino acid adenylation domain-containing protein [Pyrinomonadaceae bacterium]
MYTYNLGLRFQSVAVPCSDRPAIWLNEHQSLRYGELNALANQVARLLIDHGAKAGDVACLSGIKSVETFVTIIACLKLGVIYSVLDPDSPVERLRKILATCEPRFLFGTQRFLEDLQPFVANLKVQTFEKDTGALTTSVRDYDGTDLSQTRSVTGANPAYIMFTSGSTGIPKGALITHDSVLNLIEWSQTTFQITNDDRLTSVNPLHFDNSVFDLYSALFNGASLVPFSKQEITDPKLLVGKLDATACSLWFSVPSLLIFLQTMKAASGKNLRSIRRFVFGGEGYPKAKLKLLFTTYSTTAELFNVYGPTECTCICSVYRVTPADFEDLQGLPPLGQLADNFSYLIVDDHGKLVHPGESGELCLLGPNVGKGYYNDPERTEKSFVQNPFNSSYPEVMYKTGDLVRFEPSDGKLYILGRIDNQIKHMGYRIELEEVEAALNCLDYISEAAVLHARKNELSRLIAVVAAATSFEDETIRTDLKKIIPDYMIPSVFFRETALPKNPNGKIDRRKLAGTYVDPKG